MLTPAERIALAFELGDFDLALFCARQEIDPAAAFEQLRRSRQIGRRTSVDPENDG